VAERGHWAGTRNGVGPVEQVESAFAALGGQYRARKAAAEQAVREWRWATWYWFDLRPLHFERSRYPPGRRLRQPPLDPTNHRVLSGLDRLGRVVVDREYNEHGFFETFYDWAADQPEVALFDYWRTKEPISLMVVQMDGGRVVWAQESARGGYGREVYRWDGPLVREVEVYHAKREQGRLAPLRHVHTAKAHYDAAGVVQRVELHWPPSPPERADAVVEVVFERRGKRIYRKR
jgi:hypothetical protein